MTRATDPGLELQARAAAFNQRGFRVFPVRIDGDPATGSRKRPAISGYRGEQPFTTAELARMPWAAASGLGWALPADLLMLDVDVKMGRQGEEQLDQLQQRLGALPATAEQQTPSGGRHLVFRLGAPGVRLRATVPTADGGPSHIDVCHHRYRFVAVYDEAVFEQPIATLPPRWLEHLITRRPRRPAPDAPPADRAADEGDDDAAALIDQLRRAEPGQRNNTLNRVVYQLTVSRRWSADTAARVMAAARQVDLDDEEVRDTIASALAAGRRHAERVERWLGALVQDPRVQARRNRASLVDAAVVLGDFACELSRMTIDLSVRDLGERIGVSHATAAKILRTLRSMGFLARASLRTRETATT